MTDQDSATDQSNRTEDTDQERIEYVERTDVGVALTVELKRGTGTRDLDEVITKAKGSTLEAVHSRFTYSTLSGEHKPWMTLRTTLQSGNHRESSPKRYDGAEGYYQLSRSVFWASSSG